MRFVRLLAAALLFALIIATTAWFSAPWWLAQIARQELDNSGFEQVMLDIDFIDLQQIRISRLHLRQQESGLEINSVNATLSYSISGLLRQQLDSLSLETIEVFLHPVPLVQSENTLILASPALLFSRLPIGTINVDHISLRRLDENGDTLQALNGQANYRDLALELNMSETGSDQGLQAVLSLNAQGQCKAQLSRGDLEIFIAECLVTEKDSLLLMQGSMHANLAALDKLLATWVEIPEHRLTGEMQLSWLASLPTTANSERLLHELQLNAELYLDISLDKISQPLAASLNSVFAYDRGKGTWAVADKSLLRFGQRLQSRLSFKSLTGSFNALEPLNLSLNKGGELQLQNVHSKDMTIPKLKIKLLSLLQLSVTEASDLELEQAAKITVNTDTLTWQGKNLRSQNIDISLKPGKLTSPSGSIVINGLELLTSPSETPPALNLTADFDLSRVPLSARGVLSTTHDLLHLDWSLSHNLTNESGKLNFTLRPVQLSSATPLLARMLADSGAFGMQAGTLAGKGQLRWHARQPFSGKINLVLDNIKGFYQTTTFAGLNTNMELALNDQALHITAHTLSVKVLDPGLPLSNVSLDVIVNYPFDGPVSTQITTLKADALGGQISSELIDIDKGRKSNPFLIRLEHIDAGQLAEFRKQEGLTAEGSLDGNLPFDWTDTGLKMTAGKLASRDPGGLIRYLGTASLQQFAATDTATRMAMQILSDFRFKLLHIQADYQPDGQLALKIGIKGSNPGYENGRPIEFNFNIEENVLKLLQSLRMADEISERLEKKVQKKMQK